MRRLLSYCFLIVEIEDAVHLARQERLHQATKNEVEEESLWLGTPPTGEGGDDDETLDHTMISVDRWNIAIGDLWQTVRRF
jgi:hypothetical protein